MGTTIPARQWLIRHADRDTSLGENFVIGGFSVVTGSNMPSITIRDATGAVIGCLLGEAIDTNAERFVDEPVNLRWSAAAITAASIEHWIADLGGAFIALLVTPNFAKLYPSSTQSFVYDPETRTAAASPLALLGEAQYDARLDPTLVRDMEIEQLGWLPAGLTAHKGVSRLLPNHALDLNTWTAHRTWSGPDTGMASEPLALIADTARLMKSSMAAVATRYQVELAFTAGRDSRAVLAACHSIQDRIALFTIGHDTAGPDIDTPLEISRAFEIPHTIVAQQIANEAERARWLRLSGHCVGGSNLTLHKTVGIFGDADAIVTGAAGEVGRGFYWNDSDTTVTKLTAERLLARMDLKPLPQVVAAMRSWLDGLKGHDTQRILDLAYIELRMGCWSSPQAYGFPEAPFHVAPLNHRRIFDAVMVLPTEWRRSGRYIDDLIAMTWPELSAWPFNRFDGLRQLRYIAGKMMSYNRIRRKLRRHVIDKLRA